MEGSNRQFDPFEEFHRRAYYICSSSLPLCKKKCMYT